MSLLSLGCAPIGLLPSRRHFPCGTAAAGTRADGGTNGSGRSAAASAVAVGDGGGSGRAIDSIADSTARAGRAAVAAFPRADGSAVTHTTATAQAVPNETPRPRIRIVAPDRRGKR
jgi:hypothetical protein